MAWEVAPDFLEALLAFEMRFGLGNGDSVSESFFPNVAGGLAVTEGCVEPREAADDLDERVALVPTPGLASDAVEELNSGVLMSCFKMRLESEPSFEMMRVLADGSVSARVREDFSIDCEILLRREVKCGDRPSSSVSESNADISTG